MKKKLLNSMRALLVAAGLYAGATSAWAQTTAFSQDFTASGESTDPSDYGFTLSYGSGSNSSLVNFSVANGVLNCVAGPYASSSAGARTGTATATFDAISAGNEVTLSYTWSLGSATGNASGSYTKTRIGNNSGNALEISFYGSENNGSLKVNGTTVKSDNSAIRNTTYTVTAKLNMNTQKVTELTLTCSNTSFSYTATEAIDFASAITSVDRFAFENSERQNWANTSSIDNVNITYVEARQSVESFVVNYTFNGNVIATEEIPTAGLYAGDSYTVPFRMYVEKDGALYKTSNNSSGSYYRDVVTLTTNTVVNKALTAVDLNGGTLALLEDLDDNDGENASVRASYGLCYNNKTYTSTVTLSPGVYTFIVKALNKGRGSSIAVGSTTVTTIDNINTSKGAWTDKTITGVEIPVGGEVTLVKGGSNTIDCYDIIIAIRTGDYTIDGTIASSGYSSLASAYGLDFANATGLTAAYVITKITKDAVTLSPVAEVPAGTGVILKGSGAYSIPVKADASFSGTNLLNAAVEATPVEANEVYILQGGEFHLVTGASTVPAGKAYLLADDVPTSARSLNFEFGDEATGISSVAREVSDGEFYNLQGQRMSAPAKGLYIVNGKKVIIK